MNTVHAQALSDINNVADKATNIGNLIVELAISFAVIWIIVSVVRYLIAGGPEQRAEGGKAILYGVIGLFVILSIWGLVAILRNSFVTEDQAPDYNNLRLLPNTRGGDPYKIPANAPLYDAGSQQDRSLFEQGLLPS
jgi:hypothetical protein